MNMNMNMYEKYDWDDISIIPAVISDISSRKEINIMRDDKLPLFVAPMDMVVDEENVELFLKEGYNVCMPRSIKYNEQFNGVFYSYGLDEIIDILDNKLFLPKKVLIDVANAHMKKLYDIAKRIKEEKPEIELMVGNIANPETYRKYCEIGVDWIRISIGSGSACTTAANGAIFYPSASLTQECYMISQEFDNPAKIIADGGFSNYADIIKALALGADAVMIGGILSKTIEACSSNYILRDRTIGYEKISYEEAKELLNKNCDVYKYYRGMSTKEVQRDWGKSDLKTSEGIVKYNKVEYTLHGWTENFVDYLKSNMSYCNKKTLNDYIGKVEFVRITDNAYKRFNK